MTSVFSSSQQYKYETQEVERYDEHYERLIQFRCRARLTEFLSPLATCAPPRPYLIGNMTDIGGLPVSKLSHPSLSKSCPLHDLHRCVEALSRRSEPISLALYPFSVSICIQVLLFGKRGMVCSFFAHLSRHKAFPLQEPHAFAIGSTLHPLYVCTKEITGSTLTVVNAVSMLQTRSVFGVSQSVPECITTVTRLP